MNDALKKLVAEELDSDILDAIDPSDDDEVMVGLLLQSARHQREIVLHTDRIIG